MLGDFCFLNMMLLDDQRYLCLFFSKLVDDQRHISLSLYYNLWMKKVMPLTAGQQVDF